MHFFKSLREPKWFIDDLSLMVRHGWRQSLPVVIAGVLAIIALEQWFRPELRLIGAIDNQAIRYQESARIFRTTAIAIGLLALPLLVLALRDWWRAWTAQVWPPIDQPLLVAQRRLRGRAARARSVLVLLATLLPMAGLALMPAIPMMILRDADLATVANAAQSLTPQEVALARQHAALRLRPDNRRPDSPERLAPVLLVGGLFVMFGFIAVTGLRRHAARDRWMQRPLALGEVRFPVVVHTGLRAGGFPVGFAPGVLRQVDGKLGLIHFADRDSPAAFPLTSSELAPVGGPWLQAGGCRRFAVQSKQGQHVLIFQWRGREQDWHDVPGFVAAHTHESASIIPMTAPFSLFSRSVSAFSTAWLLLLVVYVIVEAAISTRVWLNDDLIWVYAVMGTVVVAVGGIAFLLNSTREVPMAESVVLSVMLSLAAGAATLPALKRADAALADAPAERLRYRMLEPGLFEALEKDAPPIDERERMPFWSTLKPGDEYAFMLQRGGLGLWQHDRLDLMRRNGVRAMPADD